MNQVLAVHTQLDKVDDLGRQFVGLKEQMVDLAVQVYHNIVGRCNTHGEQYLFLCKLEQYSSSRDMDRNHCVRETNAAATASAVEALALATNAERDSALSEDNSESPHSCFPPDRDCEISTLTMMMTKLTTMRNLTTMTKLMNLMKLLGFTECF